MARGGGMGVILWGIALFLAVFMPILGSVVALSALSLWIGLLQVILGAVIGIIHVRKQELLTAVIVSGFLALVSVAVSAANLLPEVLSTGSLAMVGSWIVGILGGLAALTLPIFIITAIGLAHKTFKDK